MLGSNENDYLIMMELSISVLHTCLAYDSVDRRILWRKLQRMGFKGKFLDTLKRMYEVSWC